MKPEQKIPWLSRQVAGDPVIAGRDGEVSLLFGLGPAAAVTVPEARMKMVFDALKPELRGIRWGDQIHGRVIASLASEKGHDISGVASVGRCDGLMTDEAAIGLVVWTADCVPVLMVGDGVVAAVHSGWRGAAEDIVGAAVKRFKNEYGVPEHRLRVFLGPSISGPHYPVGDEVVEALEQLGVKDSGWHDSGHVDLRHLLSLRLRDLGLDPLAISFVGPCTASSKEAASFRRDGAAAGRQYSLIYRGIG